MYDQLRNYGNNATAMLCSRMQAVKQYWLGAEKRINFLEEDIFTIGFQDKEQNKYLIAGDPI